MASDLEEIWHLTTLYGSLLDRGQVEPWVALFTDTAEFEMPGRSLPSTADRRDLAENLAPGGVHVSNPPVVELDGDTATNVQTFFFWNSVAKVGRGGYYSDNLVKIDGEWKFQKRVITFFQA